jgi:hypothetical protein
MRTMVMKHISRISSNSINRKSMKLSNKQMSRSDPRVKGLKDGGIGQVLIVIK